VLSVDKQKIGKPRNPSVLVLITGFLQPLEVTTDPGELLYEIVRQFI